MSLKVLKKDMGIKYVDTDYIYREYCILAEAWPHFVNASRHTPSKYRFNAEKYAELKQKGFRLEF